MAQRDSDIRIYQLPEAQTLASGMKVAVDSENGGTKAFDITTAMSEKVEEFVAEYNVTSYEDIDAAYKAGKSVICKYQPSPQGNPEQVYYIRSMQYIPYGPDTGGYMFGSVTAILGMEFLTCQKLNGSTVWYAYHNLALEQPSNAAANGKFLSNDGSDNVWVDPPEGVYVLNYSEISDIRDVDIDRARTQPTFLKIDTEQPLTISVPRSSGSSYTVNVQPGTIMGLEEIGPNGTSGTYSGPKFLIFGSKFGEEVGGGIMQNADFRVICCIALSAFGGVSKGLTVTGNMDSGGSLFGNINSGTQPFPITTTFFVGKGPGDPNTNRTQNALGVEFQSAGKIRKQVMMPAEIQDHDFSTDATPEQIQFMGWGATSNRAGYRTISEVPSSTAQDEGKVLTVDSNGAAAWAPAASDIEVVNAGDYDTSGSSLFNHLVTLIESGKTPILRVENTFMSPENSVYTKYNIYLTLDERFDSNDEIESFYGTTILRSKQKHNFPFDQDRELVIEVKSFGWSYFAIDRGNLTQNNPGSYPVEEGDLTDNTLTIGPLSKYLNNSFTELRLRSTQTLTIQFQYLNIPNAAITIDNTLNANNVTVTVKSGSTTLKYSVAAGNTLEAGKIYQITVVGNCWTLAEFANPS